MFGKDEKETIQSSNWVRITDDKPKPLDRVVILTFDSADCGWIMDIGWWSKDRGVWMINSTPSNHPYSHYQELPDVPPDSEGSFYRQQEIERYGK